MTIRDDELGTLGADVFEFEGEDFVTPDLDPEGPDHPHHGILRQMMEEAVQHYEQELEPNQTAATDYYHGRPYGDEVPGRSRIVTTEVRNAVLAVMPSLMRLFTGPEHLLEYEPRNLQQVPVARQMTDVVRQLVFGTDKGFLTTYAVAKDALVRKLGIVKVWVDQKQRVEGFTFSDLTAEAVEALTTEEGVELVDVQQRGAAFDPLSGEEVPLYTVEVRRVYSDPCIEFAAVPNEEFLLSPDARDLDTAPLVAHSRELPASELVAMGIPEELVRRNMGRSRAVRSDSLNDARQHHGGRTRHEDTAVARSMTPVLFTEAYALVDPDPESEEVQVAERRLFWLVGPDYEIAEDWLVDEMVPFATFSMDPEPHTTVGLSMYDYLGPNQRVNSQLMRGMLNSLALALEPSMEVVSDEVNMGDVLKQDLNKIIRVRKPGMIRDIQHDFVGREVLNVMQFMQEQRDDISGTSRASLGLDADVLQSTAKQAVAGTLSAAQQRIEFIARIMAETGFRRLYRILLRKIVQHQQRPRTTRLRSGEFVEYDPRSWDIEADVRVNIMLGSSSPEERVASLTGVVMKQSELLAAGSPIVSHVELRNALARLTEIAGFHPDEFWRPWGPEQEDQFQQQQAQQAQQAQQNDPARLLAQVEQGKTEQKAQEANERLSLERQKVLLADDRERDRLARDFALRQQELELRMGVAIKDTVREVVEIDRRAQEADIAAAEAVDSALRTVESLGGGEEDF